MNEITYDQEAERAVLGSMLEESSVIANVVEILPNSEAFYRSSHKTIYNAILSVYDEHGTLDALMVGEKIKADGELNFIGGVEEIYDILNSTPTAKNAEYYANVVKIAHLRRQLISVSTRINELAKDGGQDVYDVIAKSQNFLFDLAKVNEADYRTALDVHEDLLVELHDRKEPKIQIATSIKNLDYDKDFCTLFQPGDMVIIAGGTSSGKSSLALNICAYNAFFRDMPALFCSYEMKTLALHNRIVSQYAKVPYQLITRDIVEGSEYKKIESLRETINHQLFYTDKMRDIQALRMFCRRMVQKYSIKLIAIDYLQRMPQDKRYNSRYDFLTQISNDIKNLAIETDTVILLLSQLSREHSKRAGFRPRLTDLKESGEIENSSDVVFLIHKDYDEFTSDDNEVELAIAKNRNGPTGSIMLTFDKEHFNFR